MKFAVAKTRSYAYIVPNLDICGAIALWVSRNLTDAMLARDPCQFPQPPVTGAKVQFLRLKVEKAAGKAVAKAKAKDA